MILATQLPFYSYCFLILVQGEGLGNSTKGMVEPIQPVGNTGSAGLGWPRRDQQKDQG